MYCNLLPTPPELMSKNVKFNEYALKQWAYIMGFINATEKVDSEKAKKMANSLIKNIGSLSRHVDSNIEMGSDFAEMSFSINWKNKETGARWMNGGLIYHDYCNEWSIHT